MAVNDVYRVSIKQSVFGVRCVNVIHVKETDTASSGRPEKDVATAVVADWIPAYRALLATQWTVDCIEVVEVGISNSPEHLFVGLAGQRSAGGEALPPNSVVRLGFYTENFTAAGRGRIFISGLGRDDEQDNAINKASFDLLDALGLAIVADLTGGTGGGEYQSIILGGPPPQAAQEIVTHMAHPQVSKLRSRTMKMC